jgi:hypothetical protein
MATDTIPAPLRPTANIGDDAHASLVQVEGVWIHRGVPEESIQWDRLIEDVREERTKPILGQNEAYLAAETGDGVTTGDAE